MPKKVSKKKTPGSPQKKSVSKKASAKSKKVQSTKVSKTQPVFFEQRKVAASAWAALNRKETPEDTSHPASYFNKARYFFMWSVFLVAFVGILTLMASKGDVRGPGSITGASPYRNSSVKHAVSKKAEGPITILATGDILLARFVETKMRKAKDYTLPFQKVADFLKSADITFGNLETPLMPGGNTPTDSMVFRADIEGTKGLNFAGFDVISLANNHTMNYKAPGLLRTMDALRDAKILFAGAGKNKAEAHSPAIVDVKGRKIAFHAYNDPNIPPRFHGEATDTTTGIAKMDIEQMKKDVAKSLEMADIVIISMHAGREYVREPTQFQKDFAHAAIDAGASLVIGAHPHWVQPVEYYNDGVIFYSLGNFVFDQFFSEDVQTGLVAKITIPVLSKKVKVELFPVKIDSTQPRILEGEEKDKVLTRLGLKK